MHYSLFCQELNYTRYPINPIATMSIISLIASNGIATTKIRYQSETIKHFCSIEVILVILYNVGFV